MGATLPDNASYEPLIVQLKSMLQKMDCEKWFGYGRAGENLWQKDAAIKLIRRGGLVTTVDRILFANGAQNAIAATLAKSANDEMSPSAFEYACKNDNIKGIYLIPDYHNPTTSIMSVESRKQIAAIAIFVGCCYQAKRQLT